MKTQIKSTQIISVIVCMLLTLGVMPSRADVELKILPELAVEQDDVIMEKYLAGEEVSIDEIKKCIRKGTISSTFVPIINGAAFKNKGVQLLLNAVIEFLVLCFTS